MSFSSSFVGSAGPFFPGSSLSLQDVQRVSFMALDFLYASDAVMFRKSAKVSVRFGIVTVKVGLAGDEINMLRGTKLENLHPRSEG